MSSIDYSYDVKILEQIKKLESSYKPPSKLIIENDNNIWIPFTKYSTLLTKKSIPHCEKGDRAVSISKTDGKLELFLAPGNHIMVWDGFEYHLELVQVKERETITVNIPCEEAYYSLEKFISHARECFSQKSNNDTNNIIVKVLGNGSLWRQVSSYPKRKQDSLVTGDSTVKDILNDIKLFLSQEEMYEFSGRPFKRNYLVIGPPGSGKSSLITIIASVLNLDIYFISITSNMSEKNLCLAINALNENSLLVIEDIDILCESANSGNQGAINALASLTNILDGTLHKHKLVTVLTSANSKLLDNVLLRHGRVDYTAKLKELSKHQVLSMVKYTYNNDPDCQLLANKIWSVISDLNLSSSILANFLFINQSKSPSEITDDDCKILSLNTRKEHIKEGETNTNLWM